MRTSITFGLVVAATVVGGLFGSLLDRALVATPAWRHLGVQAWVDYSRHADLGPGKIAYPIGAILLWALIFAAAVSNNRDRSAPASPETFCCENSAGGWSLLLRVVGPFQFDWWDVAAVFVEAVVVEPGHPPGSGVFDLVDGPPRLAWFDQLSLVQPIYRLREGIIVRRSDCSDRGLDPRFG